MNLSTSVTAQNHQGSELSISKVCVLIIVLALAAIGLYSVRGLYGDGAFFLFKILTQRTFWLFDPPRQFVQILTQAPIVIGMKYGITDVTTLIYLQSIGTVGVPIGIWFNTLFQARNSPLFWPLSLCFSVTYLSSGFFAVGEFNTTYALASYCFALIMLKNFSPFSLVTLTLSSATLTRSYEAMIFLGPALSFTTLLALNHTSETKPTRVKITYGLSLIFFLAATIISAKSLLTPRDAANLAGALNLSQSIKTSHFIYISSMAALYFLSLFSSNRGGRTLWYLSLTATFLYITHDTLWHPPRAHYEFRSVSGLMLCLSFLSTIIFNADKNGRFLKLLKKKRNTSRYPSQISLNLFLALAFPFTLFNFQFSYWIKSFETAARQATNWTAIDTSIALVKTNLNSVFNWEWTNPPLSILLRGNSNGGISASANYKGWHPVEPTKQDHLIRPFSPNGSLQIYTPTR